MEADQKVTLNALKLDLYEKEQERKRKGHIKEMISNVWQEQMQMDETKKELRNKGYY